MRSCWSLLLKGLSMVWLEQDESVAVDTTVQGYRSLAWLEEMVLLDRL